RAQLPGRPECAAGLGGGDRPGGAASGAREPEPGDGSHAHGPHRPTLAEPASPAVDRPRRTGSSALTFAGETRNGGRPTLPAGLPTVNGRRVHFPGGAPQLRPARTSSVAPGPEWGPEPV